MSDKAAAIIAEFANLEGKRAPILSEFEAIAQFILPSHAYFTDQKVTPGNQDKMIDVYDTTAMRANEVLAAFLQGSITPPGVIWFKARERDKDKDALKPIREWFEEVVEPRMFMALEESNFVTSAAQLYLDLGAFCTAGLWCDDESKDLAFGRLKFTNIHLSNLNFKEGVDGKAGFIWVKMKISAANAVAQWPDSLELMPKVMEAFHNPKRAHEEFEFIVHVEPQYDDTELTGLYETSVVSVKDKEVIDSVEDTSQPFMIPRWQQATGQVWGTGPGMRALPDVMVINRAKELEMGAWEETLNRGYVTTPDNLVDDEIDRRGVTFVRDPNLLRPLVEGDWSWNVAQLKSDEIQNAIRSMFYEDRLVMPTTTGDTATEFRIRYDLLQRQLASTLGRLQTEFLNPLIERVFTLMDKGGAFGDWPAELGDKVNFDIEYVSPINKAQRMPEVEALNQWVGMIANLSQLYPELRNLPNVEDAMRGAADALDVPVKYVNDEKTYAGKNEQDQQRAQAQAQAEQNAASVPQV